MVRYWYELSIYSCILKIQHSVILPHNSAYCLGDSGGPLWLNTNDTYMDGKPQERAYLIGVIARGKGCALGNIPGKKNYACDVKIGV